MDFAGNESLAGSVQQTSGTNPPEAGGILALHSNVPNPFNSTTTITFELPGERHVRLEVFAVDGRRVATLLDARCSAGQHAITWDGRSYTGRRMASGSYFCRLTADGQVLTQRMTMLK